MARLIPFQSSFIFFLVASMCFLEVSYAGGEGSLALEACPLACTLRCLAVPPLLKGPCLMLCNLCCHKCLCVPSGTSGNKEECPCYNDFKTQFRVPCP